VLVESHDETRFLDLLKDLVRGAFGGKYRPLFRWSVTEGLQRLDMDMAPQNLNSEPTQVLKHIRSVESPGIYVLLDFHPYLSDPVHVRLLKDIAVGSEDGSRTVVLLSHELDIPPELERLSARFEMALPDENEREMIVSQVVREWSANQQRSASVDPKAMQLLVRNLAGLTRADTERLAHEAVGAGGAITASDLPNVMQAKYELLNRNGVLSFEHDSAKFSDLGGLRQFKTWLEVRRKALNGTAGNLEPPKGVMLIGVQGCGKSLAAKAAAGILNVPLLRLDFGALYNKFHGETERNLRESLKQAEVMNPCVLWIDEMEKGLATGSGDSGLSKRILGTFLTWMSEKDQSVFVVATANDISALPPELVRKGRFDEIFFVDLPSPGVRADILRIHLKMRDLELKCFDLAEMTQASNGFSGAEIEQAIVSALYTASAAGEPLATAHVLAECQRTRPLSVVMSEKITGLRAWAAERTVPAD
jgi:SpoVK/Ycf46/Vps4 family AAA+-type ATPase